MVTLCPFQVVKRVSLTALFLTETFVSCLETPSDVIEKSDSEAVRFESFVVCEKDFATGKIVLAARKFAGFMELITISAVS